jgi:hypothetical protein
MNEKSSEPIDGSRSCTTFSRPTTSPATSAAKRASAVVLIVAG